MNDPRQDSNDASVARLIRLAGVRDMPSQESMQRARAAAHAAWQRGLQTPSSRRRIWFPGWPLALAASCAMLVVFMADRWIAPAPRVVASVVAVAAGPVLLGAVREPLIAGMQLHAAARVDTGEGRAAFLLGDALSLRSDRHTHIRFEAADRLRLSQGSVYVDSGGINAVSRLRIETPVGEVRHLGTQFLVTVERGTTRIRVREGRVVLTRPDAVAQELAAGEVLEIDAGNSRLLRNMASYGAQWEWAAATAPVFDIENRPLIEFVAWIAREHGWQLAYHDDSVRTRAQDIRLHGSISGLSAMAMLRRVELITGVPLHVADGVLTVGGGEAVL
jgi:hypothetical protein